MPRVLPPSKKRRMKKTFTLLLVAVSLVAFAASGTAQSSHGTNFASNGTGKVTMATVGPGQTYTAPDGTVVTNNGNRPNDPVVNVKTYHDRKGEPISTDVNPRPGADFSVSGLDSCRDRVNIPNGRGTTAELTGHDYTTYIRGSDGNVTINGDNTHTNGTRMGSGNTINQNGNNGVGNMGGHGNTVNVTGDSNRWGNLDNNSSSSSGSSNTFTSDEQDTSC